MPITVSCPCQNTFRVKDELAGKLIKCPYCQDPVSVPASDIGSAQATSPQYGYETAASTELPQTNPYGDQSSFPYPASQPVGQQQPHMSSLDAIAQNHQAESIQKRHAGGVNGGKVLAGVAMMVGAVIWFFLGLMGNRIFFYPPILFIIGLVAFIKGLVGSSD